MEYAALNLLPILQSNAVTAGLIVNTPVEFVHRVVAERNFGAFANDVISAGMLGLATAFLPEVGIYTSPELIAYATAIGFAIPTAIKVLTGEQRLADSSLAVSLIWAGIGGVTDAIHLPISANHIAKDVLHLVGIGR
ncbi:MAG: hypothetical protein WAV30_02010 [Microgenomates group bacterium]